MTFHAPSLRVVHGLLVILFLPVASSSGRSPAVS